MSNPRIPFRLSSERARLSPPSGKPLIVHVAMNMEVWPFDQAMPRGIIQAPHGRTPKPDLANFSWIEYGLRCGFPRLLAEITGRGIPASNIMSARFPEVYPSAARALRESGWELVGHSVVQRSLQDEPDEASVIREALTLLRRHMGAAPRGWLGPGFGETLETADHLREAGLEFVFEWMVDDLPCWMHTRFGPMLALPYALDLNDVTVFALEKHTADEYVRRFEATLKVIERELADQPRVLTIALHPNIMGVPYRLDALCRVFDMLQARSDCVFMTGGQIADWYTAQVSASEELEGAQAARAGWTSSAE